MRVKETFNQSYNLVVCGGGLAGVCAAISAARLGCKVALIQDRPILGGNSSSEIRVNIQGAGTNNAWARETGILEELFLEERVHNHEFHYAEGINCIWDLTLYEAVKKEPSLTLLLNTSVRKVIKEEDGIKAVVCCQLGTEKEFAIEGEIFVDATGDGTIAFSADAEFKMGRESKDEFNESLAPENADACTMGSTLLFVAKDMGKPIPFSPLSWAAIYSKDSDLPFRYHSKIRSGYWWIEIGSPFNTITNNEEIRDELLKHVLGVWDHIKNHGDHGAENFALDWVGMVPGKRESRRIIGDYMLTENDIRKRVSFKDSVAYGGRFIDLHAIGGILAKNKKPIRIDTKVSIYPIPFRCLYSKDIKNLMLAGRDISVSHVALGSTRVMATCAIIGQAVGTAAFICKKYRVLPKDIYLQHIQELQQLLIRQDCFIPGVKNTDRQDLAGKGEIVASSSALLSFSEGEEAHPLDVARGEVFPFSEDCIKKVTLLLKSTLDHETEVELGLRMAKDIWDYKATKDLSISKSKISPRGTFWVSFVLNKKVTPKRFYWIYLKPKKGIHWFYNKNAPVATAAIYRYSNLWHWLPFGAYTLFLEPNSNPYLPENIISGVTRPERWTNIWISNPKEKSPQYIEINFNKKKVFNTVSLVLDTNLNKVHYYSSPSCSMSPFYRANECCKDYNIFYWSGKEWVTVIKIKDNYQRYRIHHFQKTMSSKLKIEIFLTNGQASAHLYEIRIYNDMV